MEFHGLPCRQLNMHQRRQSGFKSGGSWIRVKKFDFSRQISETFRYFQAISLKNFDFFQENFRKFRFLQAISLKNSISPGKFQKNFDFSGNFERILISRQKLVIYSCLLANYSISLQKSPLSN